MAHRETHKLLMALVIGVLAVAFLMPATAWAFEAYPFWIDKLTNEVLIAKDEARNLKTANFEPYLGQLLVVRTAWFRGDEAAVYRGVNRFMDMLEAREGGIPGKTADFIFDYCYEVTPAKFHDVSRHLGKYDPMWWWPLLDHGEIGGG
jgi:hypothetical protein